MNSKILKLIKQRLLIGEKKYGHQNIINDGRNFLKESLEEALDCAVYLAALLIELDDKNKKDKTNN
jgi:phage terminase large subunit GpA-like protein